MLSVPEMGDRYWLMQLIDAWNGVPHVPGTRTLGGAGGDFAIVGPGWTGELPAGVQRAADADHLGIVGGRTYVSGPEDYAAVHALQDQLSARAAGRVGQRLVAAGRGVRWRRAWTPRRRCRGRCWR